MKNSLEKKYNPDVLSCLANLSNDEVFTPPEVANQMIDLLPEELFKSDKTTFLDPCCKSGVFLREIMKRLLNAQMPGYEEIIFDINNKKLNKEVITKEDEEYERKLQDKIDWICHKQLFGISITKMTGLLSRRSVYCSKNANSKYSISHFDTDYGYIIYVEMQHKFKKGKCIYCRASESEYGTLKRSKELESHAYQFIHDERILEVLNMKFDVIIGNPPYHLSDGSGGSTDAAMPIYHKFIQQAKMLNPKYLSMIIPSKWMVGGRGLDKFRKEMLSDDSIRIIYDFEDPKQCFPEMRLDGGVCYFLRDNSFHGLTHYIYKSNDGTIIKSDRMLSNKYFKFVIRDNRINSILEKTSKDISFSEIVSTTKPFGIRKDLFNNPRKYQNSKLSEKQLKNSVHVYGVKGLKGGAKRKEGYITKETVDNKEEWINKYKIFFTTSYSTNAIEPPKPIIGKPNDVCTETFLVIGPFKNETEMQNCLSYMNTSFFKFLLYHGKGSMQVTKTVFSLIPLISFKKKISDRELYNKYNISEEEIKLIESMIKPMSNGEGDVNAV